VLARLGRALIDPLGFSVAANMRVNFGEVLKRKGNIGVVESQRLFADRERAFVERLCVGALCLARGSHYRLFKTDLISPRS
jgi:hypothetical protein